MKHPSSLELEAAAVGERTATVDAHLRACDACRSFVDRLGGLAAPAPKRRAPRWPAIAGALVPVLAAAVVLLVLRRAPADDVVAPRAPLTASAEAPEPDTTFKGAVPIAVIRERDGQQVRFTRDATIRPGDRLRVEVALDREQVISAGVLGDDGSWLELMAESPRAAGTHFSEQSAKVDTTPLRGTILVGPRAQVAAARLTRDFGQVASLRLEWETP